MARTAEVVTEQRPRQIEVTHSPPASLKAARQVQEPPANVESTPVQVTADESDSNGGDVIIGHTPETEALFTQLYQQYDQAIYAYVYRMLGDSEDARDFTQDAFVKAYKRLPVTIAKGNFQPQAWLYKIATNVCLDQIKHRKLLKWQPWETFVSLFHPSQVAKDNPEKEAMQGETKHEVELVLEKLSEKYRVVLVLREYHGLGQHEIAEIMGVSYVAAKSLIQRARGSFRLHYVKQHPKFAAE